MCVIQHLHTHNSRFNKVWGPLAEIPMQLLLPIPPGDATLLCPEHIICYWLFIWTQILQNLKFFPENVLKISDGLAWGTVMHRPSGRHCSINLIRNSVSALCKDSKLFKRQS